MLVTLVALLFLCGCGIEDIWRARSRTGISIEHAISIAKAEAKAKEQWSEPYVDTADIAISDQAISMFVFESREASSNDVGALVSMTPDGRILEYHTAAFAE